MSLVAVDDVESDDGDKHNEQRDEDADEDDVSRRYIVIVAIVVAVDHDDHNVTLLTSKAVGAPAGNQDGGAS